LDVSNGTPKIVEQNKDTKNPIKISDINPSGSFTCSDCVSLGEHYPKGIPENDIAKYNDVRGNGIKSIVRNNLKYTISDSGSKNPKILEENLLNGQRRLIYSSRGLLREVHFGNLDLSADGLKMAFQESSGFGSFIGDSTLKVVNINNGRVINVSDIVYGDSHWSSDSKRIYYYHCKDGGRCGPLDGIYYSDI
jgi:hypothetical protein